MRNNDHETRFCGSVGGGLRPRIDARLCPRGLGMAPHLSIVAASCAILPLSWDHRRRGCPPSKTGFRPRSRHLRSRPSSTGPRRAAHTGGLCRRSTAYPLSIAYSRAAWAATLASPGLLPILLLVGSNLFMTLAWYA